MKNGMLNVVLLGLFVSITVLLAGGCYHECEIDTVCKDGAEDDGTLSYEFPSGDVGHPPAQLCTNTPTPCPDAEDCYITTCAGCNRMNKKYGTWKAPTCNHKKCHDRCDTCTEVCFQPESPCKDRTHCTTQCGVINRC